MCLQALCLLLSFCLIPELGYCILIKKTPSQNLTLDKCILRHSKMTGNFQFDKGNIICFLTVTLITIRKILVEECYF